MKKNNIFLSVILVLLASIFSLNSIISNPTSPDSYLHMRAGKQILLMKKIPNHNDISYKKVELSLEWIEHSWLSDSIIYLSAYKNIYVAIFLVLIPLLVLSLFLSRAILIQIGVSTQTQIITLVSMLLVSPVFWKLHPLVFIVPLLLSLVYVCNGWLLNSRKTLFEIPLILFLVANFAGGFIFIAVAILLLFLLSSVLIKWLKYGQYTFKMRELVLVLIISLLVTMINPLGYRIHIYLLTFLGVFEFKDYFSGLTGALSIMNQSYIKQSLSSVHYIYYLLMFLTTSVLNLFFLIRDPQNYLKNGKIVLYLFPLFLLPFFWIRLLPLTAFLTLPLLAIALDRVFGKYNFLLPLLLKLALCTYTLYLLFYPPVQFAISYPKKQLEIIKQLNLSPNVFTSSDISSYASYDLYPSRLFVDAQDDFFDENETIDFYRTASIMSQETYSSIFETNEVSTVVTNKDIANIAITLNARKEWALIFIETNGFVFVNRNSVTQEFLNENELKYINLRSSLGFDSKQIGEAAKELEKFIKKYPDTVLARGQLATIYRIMKKNNLAEKVLLQIPIKSRNYIVNTELGRLKASENQCYQAEQFFLSAVNERGEQNYSKATLDLAVLYAACLNDQHKAKHFFERYNSYVLPSHERSRLKKIMQDFNIQIEE